MASKEQITQLRDLGAATVYEAQGAKGALDSGMKPIDPTTRLAGPALTVDARPADNLILHYAVQKASPGDVLVVDAKGFMEAGPWGDVLTIQAMKIGIAALVINGCVRDANLIISLGFPVFCRGLSTAISSSMAREQKEEQQRKAIEQGATTADLLNLTDTLRRLGLV